MKEKPAKPSKSTDPKERLQRAISYWIKHDPISSQDEIKRVARKFGVHPNSLKEAIKAWAEMKRRSTD